MLGTFDTWSLRAYIPMLEILTFCNIFCTQHLCCHPSRHVAIMQNLAFEANFFGNMFAVLCFFFIYFGTLKIRLIINRICYILLPCLQALHPYPEYVTGSIEITFNIISTLLISYLG